MGKDTCAICGGTLKRTFRFPTKRFDQWAKLACVSKAKLQKNKRTTFRLCIDHFKDDDLRETALTVRLQPGTEPSELLPYQEKAIDEAKYIPFYEEAKPTIYDTQFGDISSSSARRDNDKQEELPTNVLMDLSLARSQEKEEYYDDIKLPVTLIRNEDGVHNGVFHPTSSRAKTKEKCQCCDSCRTEGVDSEDETANRKVYECPHCGLRFLLSIALKYHIKGSHGPDQFYQCSYCQFSSHILSQVRRHVRESHTMEKRHSCPHCKYKAKRSTHLRRHIEARHDASRPPRRQYIKHEDAIDDDIPTGLPSGILGDEDEEKPLVCTECNYTTMIPRSLKRHIKNAHEGNSTLHRCTKCDFKCGQLRELRHHVKVDHENLKCFDCPLCSYRTVHLGSLKNHIMAKHTDEKGHKCPHCRYSAVQSGNLKRHMKTKHPNKQKAKAKQKTK